MVDYGFKFKFSNVIGHMMCCGALLVYPFEHDDWCPFGEVEKSDIVYEKNDMPVNVKRPFMEGDVLQDYHTGIKYKRANGKWNKIEKKPNT